MTSVLRRTASVPTRRIGYFRTFDAAVTTPLFTINSGYTLQQVMTTTAWDAATTTGVASLPIGRVLKDMGDEVRTVDSNGFHTASFRRIQLEYGDGSEGVGDNTDVNNPWKTYYVCVWSANYNLDADSYPVVRVVRIG